MNYTIVNDEWGTWHVYPGGLRVLVEPSQKWHDEHPAREPDDPTPDDDAITAEEALAILLGGDTE